MILSLNESWWARYFPQIYLVVLASILILDNCNKKTWIKVLKYVFIFIILVNNFITFYGAVKRAYEKNVVFNTEFTAFENAKYDKDNTLILYTKAFHGAKYNLLDKYGEVNILKRAIGYKEVIKYLNSEITKEECLELIQKNSRHYAKRQYTWFNNKMDVKWFLVDFNNFNNTYEKVINYIEKDC